jgi:hypothetical protein
MNSRPGNSSGYKYETQRSYLKTEEHFNQLKQREEDFVDIKKFINGQTGPSRHECLLTQEDTSIIQTGNEIPTGPEDVIKADKVYWTQWRPKCWKQVQDGQSFHSEALPSHPKSAHDKKEEPKTAPNTQPPKLTLEERQSLSQEGKCFYCKEKGHWATEE